MRPGRDATRSDAEAAGPEIGPVLEGVVVRGDGRGRALGFPTANVALDRPGPGEEALPDGVYAGLLRRPSGRVEVAAVSIGRRPTYYGHGGERLVEAHLLDFDEDLYGEAVALLVGPKVRGQERFASSEALVAQMHADIEQVRRLAPSLAAPTRWAVG